MIFPHREVYPWIVLIQNASPRYAQEQIQLLDATTPSQSIPNMDVIVFARTRSIVLPVCVSMVPVLRG